MKILSLILILFSSLVFAASPNLSRRGALPVVDIQSVYFGGGVDCATVCNSGTCTICNKVGTKITSVTWVSTGTYRLNGIDGTKYNCTGQGYGFTTVNIGIIPVLHGRPGSTTSYATLSPGQGTTNYNSFYNSVTCVANP